MCREIDPSIMRAAEWSNGRPTSIHMARHMQARLTFPACLRIVSGRRWPKRVPDNQPTATGLPRRPGGTGR